MSKKFRIEEKGYGRAWTMTDRAHIPDNKRPGEVSSMCILEIINNDNGSVSFAMVELTDGPSGRTSRRSISTTVPAEMVDGLRQFINR